MSGVWGALGIAQSAALAASGAVNAAYFAHRVARASGSTRIAAAVLLCIFAGIALDGVVHLSGHASAAVEIARRAPLLVATLVTTAVLRIGAGR